MDEEKEELVTLRLEMGSNNVNNTLKKIGYAQFVYHRGPQDNWYSQEIEPKHLDQLCKTLVECIT